MARVGVVAASGQVLTPVGWALAREMVGRGRARWVSRKPPAIRLTGDAELLDMGQALVFGPDGAPLRPTNPGRARQMVRDGRAWLVTREPLAMMLTRLPAGPQKVAVEVGGGWLDLPRGLAEEAARTGLLTVVPFAGLAFFYRVADPNFLGPDLRAERTLSRLFGQLGGKDRPGWEEGLVEALTRLLWARPRWSS